MHFTFDTGRMVGFKHRMGVMHFTFDTKDFTFDTGFFVSPLFIKDYFFANSISNIFTNSRDSFAVHYY